MVHKQDGEVGISRKINIFPAVTKGNSGAGIETVDNNTGSLPLQHMKL